MNKYCSWQFFYLFKIFPIAIGLGHVMLTVKKSYVHINFTCHTRSFDSFLPIPYGHQNQEPFFITNNKKIFLIHQNIIQTEFRRMLVNWKSINSKFLNGSTTNFTIVIFCLEIINDVPFCPCDRKFCESIPYFSYVPSTYKNST